MMRRNKRAVKGEVPASTIKTLNMIIKLISLKVKDMNKNRENYKLPALNIVPKHKPKKTYKRRTV